MTAPDRATAVEIVEAAMPEDLTYPADLEETLVAALEAVAKAARKLSEELDGVCELPDSVVLSARHALTGALDAVPVAPPVQPGQDNERSGELVACPDCGHPHDGVFYGV